jgi:hypothetical protein
MGRKFLEGLIFGAGVAVAFIAFGGIAFFLWPAATSLTPAMDPESAQDRVLAEQGVQFHRLPLEEQIRTASVIALARYEPAPDGRRKAIIKEFLKKDSGTVLYYKEGDEYSSASFYPEQGVHRGDGLIIFFVGSPADMRMSMSFSGDRIRGLGDIPVELFKRKCEEAA